MINVSNAFRKELYNDNRNYLLYADITLADGTELNLDNSDFWQGGFSIEDSVSSSDTFTVGGAVINKLTLVINNIYEEFSEYDFSGAEIEVKVGLKLPDGITESFRKGLFIVDETKYNGSLITLTCLDNMSKFDRSYSESVLGYPATLMQIVQDACQICDVTLQSYSFPHDDFIVQNRPSDEATTFREVISWAAQIACCFARCDTLGRLEIKWYNTAAIESEDGLDGGIFDSANPYDSGDTADGGTFNPWTNGDEYDGGTFENQNYHHIFSNYSIDIATDDVVITGVKVTVPVESEESSNDFLSYLSGSNGYVIGIEGNDLIQGEAGETVAGWLGAMLIGLRFRSGQVSHSSNPTIEAGDVAFLTTRNGNSYPFLVSYTKFGNGGSQSTESIAETPSRNSATRYSASTKNYVEFRKNLKQQKTEFNEALDELGDRVDNSSGLFTTEEEQPDGSTIFYMHDKPTLEESQIVWKMTAEAIAVSTDGGKTYNGGMTVDADAIVRILTAVGVNADWINSGAISIEDEDGNETFYADTETGAVRINADSFSLSGRTIQEISGEEAESAVGDFIDTIYSPEISNLQAQIDGQIETWFYNYVPTTSNAPANEWTTDTEKEKHLGDLFYVVDNEEYGGQAYRWALINGEYKWDYVEDTAVVKALSDAEKAQDTADSKRRVFITTPVPPYDIGDLWSQGANGDIMRCKTARQSGSYVSTDWEKASKYTDDSAVDNLDESLDQEGVFNRLTNNGQTQGIYIQDGLLYINATYIVTGKIASKNGLVFFDLDNNEIHCDKLVSTQPYSLVANTVVDVTRRNIGGSRYVYGVQIYNEDYETKRVTISPGNSDDHPTISTGTTNDPIGILIKSLVNNGNFTGNSYLEFLDNGWIELAAPTGGSLDPLIRLFPGYYTNLDGTTSDLAGSVTISGTTIDLYATDVNVSNRLNVKGSKSRLVKTKDYGERLFYCYETSSPMFGDTGEASTDENGECIIALDDIFLETVTSTIEYQVFLQKEGQGDLWVDEKTERYFTVKGTENLKFSWEVKVKQRDYEYERLDEHGELYPMDEVTPEILYENEIEDIIAEQEAVLYEAAK